MVGSGTLGFSMSALELAGNSCSSKKVDIEKTAIPIRNS
jgi:hypothetical protein